MRAVRPELIVCLGATAARSVVGRVVRVLTERGQRLPTEFGVEALITVHPSALLRLRDRTEADAAFAALVRDLELIRDQPRRKAKKAPSKKTGLEGSAG